MLCQTICEDCERVFLDGPNAFFCPSCRKERLSAAAKKRNLNKLGNEAYSMQSQDRIGVAIGNIYDNPELLEGGGEK